MRLSRFTIDTQMKLSFAGATHASDIRVRVQICMTPKNALSPDFTNAETRRADFKQPIEFRYLHISAPRCANNELFGI
jgi:hypothetical protein